MTGATEEGRAQAKRSAREEKENCLRHTDKSNAPSYPPTAIGYPPTAVGYPPCRSLPNRRRSAPSDTGARIPHHIAFAGPDPTPPHPPRFCAKPNDPRTSHPNPAQGRGSWHHCCLQPAAPIGLSPLTLVPSRNPFPPQVAVPIETFTTPPWPLTAHITPSTALRSSQQHRHSPLEPASTTLGTPGTQTAAPSVRRGGPAACRGRTNPTCTAAACGCGASPIARGGHCSECTTLRCRGRSPGP